MQIDNVLPNKLNFNITVIIVTYNGMRWYEKCFNSLRNSTIPLNTIVIDNNSSDNTIDYIKENYPEIHLVESDVNLGFGKANNVGLEYALKQDADYVYLLNQDAWLKSDTIEKMVQIAETQPEFGVVSPIHLSGDEKKIDFNQMYHLSPIYCPGMASDFFLQGKLKDKIYEIEFVNAAHWLISKKCVETVGGFSSLFFLYGEDNNYLNRAKYFGFKVGLYPHAFGIHDRFKEERHNTSYKKKKVIERSTSFYILANIQIRIKRCLKDVLYYNLSNSLYNLINLNIKYSFLHILILLETLFSLNKVQKHRCISGAQGAYLRKE